MAISTPNTVGHSWEKWHGIEDEFPAEATTVVTADHVVMSMFRQEVAEIQAKAAERETIRYVETPSA